MDHVGNNLLAKNKGGLGIKNLETLNISILLSFSCTEGIRFGSGMTHGVAQVHLVAYSQSFLRVLLIKKGRYSSMGTGMTDLGVGIGGG